MKSIYDGFGKRGQAKKRALLCFGNSETALGGPFKPSFGLSGDFEEGAPFKQPARLSGKTTADLSDGNLSSAGSSNWALPNKLFTTEIIYRDPLQVTVADINRLYFGKTDAHRDLLHREVNLTALPQNWKDDLMRRAQSR